MGPGEFLNINFFTALFTLLNTIALFLVLKKFLWGPVMNMIAQRQQARKDRNFALADQIRKELADKGILLEDTREGVKWKRA